MTDQHKAFYLSLALSILETIKEHEKPKSARFNKIDNVIDGVSRATDIYRPVAWKYEEMKKAEQAHDRINEMIQSMFSE